MFRSKMRLNSRLIFVLLGGTALLADGSQTGTLLGTIKDTKDVPVGSAVVRVAGSTLMGERTIITDEEGRFLMPKLPPGTDYTVTVSKAGFHTVAMSARIAVDQVLGISVELRSQEAAAVVEVLGEYSTVDTTTVVSTVSMNKNLVDALPMPFGRGYQGIMAVAPGMTGSDNPTALGGRRTENLYLVDGVDTTDATSGTYGMNLNEEAIEEVQILTAGLSAEYGRVGGAVSNVVTKSGSNEFTGSFRMDLSNMAWDAKGMRSVKPESFFTTRPFLSVGGPVFKDKLWYFVTAQWTQVESTQSSMGPLGSKGLDYKEVFQADPVWYSAKLSWQINQNHWINLQATGDPSKYPDGVALGSSTTLDTLTRVKQGSNFLAFTYQAMPFATLNWDFKYSRRESAQEFDSLVGNDIWGFVDWGDINRRVYENAPQVGDIKRTRDQFNASLTWYPSNHQIRMGVDIQSTTSRSHLGSPGNTQVVFTGYKPSNANWPYEFPVFLWRQQPPQTRKSQLGYQAYFINDKWKLNRYLALNLGLRMELTDGENDAKEKLWDITAFSPRLGATWDWKGDGKQCFGVFLARYALQPLQSTLDGMTRAESTNSFYLYRPLVQPVDPAPDPHLPGSYYQVPETFQGKASNLYPDKDAEAGHEDELTLSFKMQLAQGWTLDSMVVARDYKNPLVVYRSFNGQDDQGYDIQREVLKNAKDAVRKYRGWITSLNYAGEKWNLAASYTLSTLKGNIDADNHDNDNGGPNDIALGYGWYSEGTYKPDYNDRRVYGFLKGDQTHVVRLMSSYRHEFTPKFLMENGLHAEYSSGMTWTRYGLWIDENKTTPSPFPFSGAIPIALPKITHPVTKIGERGDMRFPDYWRLHYAATFRYKFTDRYQASFALRIMNLLNTFKVENYRTDMVLDQQQLNQNKKVVLTGGEGFLKSTRYEDYTPGRSFYVTLGLKF